MITLIDEVVDISRANAVVPLLEPGHDYGQLTIRGNERKFFFLTFIIFFVLLLFLGCTFKDGSLKVILDKLKRNNSVIKFVLTGNKASKQINK